MLLLGKRPRQRLEPSVETPDTSDETLDTSYEWFTTPQTSRPQRVGGEVCVEVCDTRRRMDASSFDARVQEILDGGGGEPVAGGARFLPLVTLESGARCGLDREGRWLLVPADGRPAIRYAPAAAYLFHEALEWQRARFDDAIEEAARACGLPAEQVVDTFPAVDVVRAVREKEHPYLTRLALSWIRPTELRALRAELRAVTKAANMPLPVKDLAARLIVPE